VTREGEKTWFQKVKESGQFFLIVFGAAWGIYPFVYKDIIVPARRPPAVNLAAQMDELDRADGMILVRAHIVVTNRGESIDQFEATKWSIDDEGILTPIMQVKQKRWYESRAAVVPFQPETEMRHRRIGESHDAGHNSTSASLRLKPGPSTVPPPKAPR
jgi:hypothetical protein